MQASNCGNATINQNVTPPNAQVQFVTLPPQFTNMQVDCNTNVNALCATSLNITDSTVVLDTTIPGQYTNLNDYNFLRSNKSIFPTFDNDFIITPTDGTTVFFGIATAISGDGSTVAIGAADSGTAGNPAYVAIYRRQGTAWVLSQRINMPLPTAVGFGSAIALSYDGAVLAVGTADDSGTQANTPAAYVALYTYKSTLSQYTLDQLIAGSSLSAFGSAIALSATGQYLVISESIKAITTSIASTFIPAAYVYTRSNTCNSSCNNSGAWELEAYLTCSENNGTPMQAQAIGATFSSQRIDISADGSTIALGVPNRFTASLFASAVVIFKRTGSAWKQTQLITNPNPPSANQLAFGWGVALSGNGKYLAAKASRFGASGVGACYIFGQHGSTYSLNFSFISSIFFQSTGGVAFSHDGTTLAIGAGANPNANGLSGEVFVALRGPNNQWSVPFSLLGTSNNNLGFSVACSADGAFIVAGEPGGVSGPVLGQAHVFRPVGSFIPNDTVITGSLCVYHRTTIDAALKVAGNVHLNGTIVTGTAGHVTACTAILCDNRMKDNIAPLSAEDALAKLNALTPVSFEYVNPYYAEESITSQQASKGRQNEHVGFIAQHVEHVFPQFVGSRHATDSEAPLITDGNTKTILIRAELYAHLIASLEKLVERNEQRKQELACLPFEASLEAK